MQEATLNFRFKYKPDFTRISTTNNGRKIRIVSCTRNKIPCYSDRILDLRFNVNVKQNLVRRYLDHLTRFEDFIGVQIEDREHNSKVVLKDSEYIEVVVLDPFRSEEDMWISQSGKSKVLASFTVPSDISALPFSDCLEIYFAIFTQRHNLNDDSDIEHYLEQRSSINLCFDL